MTNNFTLPLQSTAVVGYNAVQRIGGTYNPAEVDPKPDAPLGTSNLGLGLRGLGNVTDSHHKTQVGRFIERDRTSRFLPDPEKQNAPQIQRQNYVRDGHGSFNPSNGLVFDPAIADTSRSRPIHRIGLSSVSLPVIKGSSGLPRGRDKGICVALDSLTFPSLSDTVAATFTHVPSI